MYSCVCVQECVNHFSKTERLSSPWKCPKCKTMRDAEKQLLIWKLPRILLILLKRYYNSCFLHMHVL
jgi:ubiquitin C-terminal hydrolase